MPNTGIYFLFTQNEPVRVGRETTFRLVFWRQGGGPSGPFADPGFVPYVWLWMRMPGGDDHGSFPIEVVPTRDEANQVVPGSFEVTQVVFNMAQEWEVHLELRQNDGTIADAVFQTIWI